MDRFKTRGSIEREQTTMLDQGMLKMITHWWNFVFASRSWDAVPDQTGQWIMRRWSPSNGWEERPATPSEEEDAKYAWAIK